MRKFLYKIKKEESGTIIIIVCVCLVAIMGIMALAIDIGSAYLNTGQLQKVADAAVYSAGQKLPIPQENTTKINEIKDSAIYYAEQNGYSNLNRSDVVLGNIVKGFYTDIKVTVTNDFEMNFAKTFGVNSIEITKSAKAMLSPKAMMTGAAPLGILKSELDGIIQNGQSTSAVLKYGSSTEGTGENGFFGALDLDGQGGGASDYRLWIAQGFPGEALVGDVLLKQSGNIVGPTFQGFSTRFNSCTHFGAHAGGTGCTLEHYDPSCPRVAKIIVYENNGSSTAIITGFAAFVLEDQTQSGYITGSFVGTLVSGGQGTGEAAGTGNDYGVYSLMISE